MTDFLKRLAQNRLLDVGAVALAILSVAQIASFLPARASNYDFSHYYASSRLLRQGHNPYLTPLAPAFAEHGFFYGGGIPTATNPPLLLWLFVPLTLLPPGAAFAVWVMAQAVSLAAILWLTRRLLRAGVSNRGWLYVCAGALTSSAVCWHFYFSHVELLLAALLLGAYGCLRAGNGVAACALAAVAGTVKLYPLLLLPWFVWRGGGDARERMLGATVAVGTGLAAVLLTGPALWRDFFQHGLGVVAGWVVNRTFNFSVPSLVANLAYGAGGFDASAQARQWAVAVGTMVGLVVVGVAYARVVCGGRDREAEFSLLSVAMLAGNPTTWGYYFVFLIFPMSAAAARLVADPRRWRILGWLLILLAVNNLYHLGAWDGAWSERHPGARMAANYIPLYGLVALGVFFANQLGRSGAGREP